MDSVMYDGGDGGYRDFERVRRQPKPTELPKPKEESEVELTREQKMAKYFAEATKKSEEIMVNAGLVKDPDLSPDVINEASIGLIPVTYGKIKTNDILNYGKLLTSAMYKVFANNNTGITGFPELGASIILGEVMTKAVKISNREITVEQFHNILQEVLIENDIPGYLSDQILGDWNKQDNSLIRTRKK